MNVQNQFENIEKSIKRQKCSYASQPKPPPSWAVNWRKKQKRNKPSVSNGVMSVAAFKPSLTNCPRWQIQLRWLMKYMMSTRCLITAMNCWIYRVQCQASNRLVHLKSSQILHRLACACYWCPICQARLYDAVRRRGVTICRLLIRSWPLQWRCVRIMVRGTLPLRSVLIGLFTCNWVGQFEISFFYFTVCACVSIWWTIK